jgi:N-hydroxyarylamine O-acetyltransferase
VQGSNSYRIVSVDDALILLRRKSGENWNAEYRFDLQAHVYADYEEMCRFHQTSPESHFTRGRICSLATEDGRVTLSDMRLITTRGQLRDERLLADQDEYNRMLRDTFGIVMK